MSSREFTVPVVDESVVSEVWKNSEEYISCFRECTKTLASDEFEGRFPNTIGEKKTIEYLTEEFKKVGAEPGNQKDNSFVQQVPVVQITGHFKDEEVLLRKQGDANPIKWKQHIDFVGKSRRMFPTVDIDQSQVVFVGFGITAPEYGWNDYEGVDVKGKSVIVLINDPGFYNSDPKFFKGSTLTYYGRWTYKYEEASRRGASAVLIVHDTAAASYPWSVVVNGAKGPSVHAEPNDKYVSRCAMEGWISTEAAKEFFASFGKDYDEYFKKAATRNHQSFEFPCTLSLSMTQEITTFKSDNFFAMIKGSDRPDEYVFYSAHWDHFGKKGDEIFYGARDNASGVAGLLVLAKAYKALPKAPSRSIIFFSSTGEEQGLIGAEYYATAPLVPLEKTAAIINMDMLNIFGRVKDVSFYGWGNSELDEYAKVAAKLEDRQISPEPKPEDGLFFRSDHFPLIKKGVAGMFLAFGTQSREFDADYVPNNMHKWFMESYHKTADRFTDEWKLDGIIDDLRLLFRVGYYAAVDTKFPKLY